MTAKEIINSLYGMSDSEVRMINQAAYGILNGKRKKTIAEKKRSLHIGMRVTFDHGRRSGTIVKINRTRCIVDTGAFRNWTVPMTMIEPV
tara:strand:- start:35712 stop:35981 length:270 start_codon:yes stop_codon:yes gene_type:complete